MTPSKRRVVSKHCFPRMEPSKFDPEFVAAHFKVLAQVTSRFIQEKCDGADRDSDLEIRVCFSMLEDFNKALATNNTDAIEQLVYELITGEKA